MFSRNFFKVSTPWSEIMCKNGLYNAIQYEHYTKYHMYKYTINFQHVINMLTKLYIILTMEHSTKNQTLLLKEVILND